MYEQELQNLEQRFTNALRELEDVVKNQGYLIARMKHAAEQYDRLADYVIANGLWRGHQGGHTDSVIRHIKAVEGARDKLREALRSAPEPGTGIIGAMSYKDGGFIQSVGYDAYAKWYDRIRKEALGC